MKIAIINMLPNGSTGKIMFDLANVARQAGNQVWTFSPRYYQRIGEVNYPELANHFNFGTYFENMVHLRLSELTGLHGYFSYFGTKELLRKLDEIKPDIIHLHNLHNCSIDIPLLFKYIKNINIRTVWTLHDCWSFTGKCPHFTIVKCERWRTGCYKCPQLRQYPRAFTDRTKMMWRKKRAWFTGVNDMTLVTPSEWLANLAKQSFLHNYNISVINNGIDLSVFRYTTKETAMLEKFDNKRFKLLGVADVWSDRKGLDVFIRLSKELPKEEYQIILVGTNERVDKLLPDNITSIHHTQNQEELALIYSSVDLLVNPTREEVFGLVNVEALACGTPVLTFATGGCTEIVDDTCGIAVKCDDVERLELSIRKIAKERPFSKEACIKHAKKYDKNSKYQEYIKLYNDVYTRKQL